MRFNPATMTAIIQADCRGASAEDMKELYIPRNSFDLDLDAPIYRIKELQYFCEDLHEKCLTHIKINKLNWNDSSENPLLNRTFPDTVTDMPLTLNGLVDTVYGSCWSATAFNTLDKWATFSHRKPCVRLQSTPRKLLNAVMNTDNQLYMLQHFIGRMQYAEDNEIEDYFSDSNWEKHLDSLGQGIAASFLQLSKNLSSEDEVRLIYNHLDEAWPKDNVRLIGQLAKVPFDWSVAIDGVVVGPFGPEDGEAIIRDKLKGYGTNCSVSSCTIKANDS